MSEFLYNYPSVEPASWFYLSSLLMVGLFFKFGRFWSGRNLDLLLLILLGPGLLFVYYGQDRELNAINQVQTAAFDSVEVADLSNESGEANATKPPATTSDETKPSPTGSTDKGRVEIVPADRELSGVLTAADVNVGLSDPGDEGKPTAIDESVASGRRLQKLGYLWLFCCGVLLLARMLTDPTMVRRPMLEPNLTGGGLTFIGCSLFVFLMANVVNTTPSNERDHQRTAAPSPDRNESEIVGPGFAHLNHMPLLMRKIISIASHLAIVVGMVLIGYWHFDNIVMGVGGATLYLMLPYTSIMTNQAEHVIPGSLLVLAVVTYRRPLMSGIFLGVAGGLSYYPLFLLPLWFSFYWSRGLMRFIAGLVLALFVLTVLLVANSATPWEDVCLMYGIRRPVMEGLRGIWSEPLNGWSRFYRIPVLATFVALASGMTLWPAQKNLGSLLSCSAAVMVATQFWHGYGGGIFMAWYLPLLLLTIFRPNLEDRVALSVVKRAWLPKRFRRVDGAMANL